MKSPIAAAILALALSLPGTTAKAQAPRGPVHSARAAILMARRIWINLNPPGTNPGAEADWLKNEKATVDGAIWEVAPKNLGPDAPGGNIVFRIASDDGHMVGFYRP